VCVRPMHELAASTVSASSRTVVDIKLHTKHCPIPPRFALLLDGRRVQ